MPIYLYILVGIAGGLLSGAFGIGGGTIMVPAMVLLFGLTQHQAQGTSLAVMMVPVFILAVWRYYVAGNVNVQMALFIAMGFIVGGLLGAHFVQGVSDANLKRAFGIFLIVIGIKMAFLK